MEELRVWNIFWTAPWQKNLEQFLLIQQFWLMGTTSIPQPVITTAQFPISASHTGMPRKSSLRSPIFRHFSSPSPAHCFRACRRACWGVAHPRPPNRWPYWCNHTLDPHSEDEDSGRKGLRLKPQGKAIHLSVSFCSQYPGFDWQLFAHKGRRDPAGRHQEMDQSLSEDVPAISIRSVLQWGGALGFAKITTPFVKTVDAWKTICCRFPPITEHVVMSSYCMKMTMLQRMKKWMWLQLQSLFGQNHLEVVPTAIIFLLHVRYNIYESNEVFFGMYMACLCQRKCSFNNFILTFDSLSACDI